MESKSEEEGGITMHTEEEIEQIEVDKDTSSDDASDNLHKNRNSPCKSEV